MKKLFALLMTACMLFGSMVLTSCDVADVMNSIGISDMNAIANNSGQLSNGNGNGNGDFVINSNGNGITNGNSFGDSYLGMQPYALYASQMGNAKKANNVTITVDAINRVTILGTETTTEENFTLKLDGIKFSADMLIHEEHFEQKIVKKLWCMDGYLYSESGEELIKESIDEAYVEEKIAELKASYDTYLFNFTEEYFADAKFTFDQYGASMTLDLTSEEISALLTEATGVPTNITAEACKVSISYDLDGNVSGYIFELDGVVNADILGSYEIYMRYDIQFSLHGKTNVDHPEHSNKFKDKNK